MTPLRRRMTQDMQLRNFAPGSVNLYVDCVARFARHFGKSPEILGPENIRAYLLQLIEQRRPSWSYYNQNVQALRLLYKVTLGRDWVSQHIACPKQPKRLPVVLSPAEVARFFAAVDRLKDRALLMTAYAAGLRISEVVALRVEDIDSRRMVIRVRQGKGRKDRYVGSPATLVKSIRTMELAPMSKSFTGLRTESFLAIPRITPGSQHLEASEHSG